MSSNGTNNISKKEKEDKVLRSVNPKWNLKGKRISITGTLEHLERNEFEDFVILAQG